MSFPTLAAVKAAVKTILASAPGIGTIETRFGGVPTWLTDPRPGRNYWVISVLSRREQDATIGLQAFQFLRVQLDGTMPHAYENPDTTALWDALLEAVCTQLRGNRSLLQNASVVDEGLPQIVSDANPPVMVADVSGDLVRCHRARIECLVQTFSSYTTA